MDHKVHHWNGMSFENIQPVIHMNQWERISFLKEIGRNIFANQK
jgi:hypothetical protein